MQIEVIVILKVTSGLFLHSAIHTINILFDSTFINLEKTPIFEL